MVLNFDVVERRLAEAARIPHDMPKMYSWHRMELLPLPTGLNPQTS